MRVSNVIGSWPAIIGLPTAFVGAKLLGVPDIASTYVMSITALTLSQLIMREQNRDSKIDKEIQDEQLRVEREIKDRVAC